MSEEADIVQPISAGNPEFIIAVKASAEGLQNAFGVMMLGVPSADEAEVEYFTHYLLFSVCLP